LFFILFGAIGNCYTRNINSAGLLSTLTDNKKSTKGEKQFAEAQF
jgi:hypothetical protein